MVAQAASGKKPLPEMMTSIRLGEDGRVEIVDQLLLPHEAKWIPVESPNEAYDAIKSMKIRGAPAIASLAALSIAWDLRSNASASSSSPSGQSSTPTPPAPSLFKSPQDLSSYLHPILDHLQSSRPTAVNLSEALNRIRATLKQAEASDLSGEEAREKVREVCKDVHGADLRRCIEMGRLGAEWLWSKRGGGGSQSQSQSQGQGEGKGKEGLKVITVCNTGSLATSGYGTAIGVITALYEHDHLDRAYYAQTTPYHQGSRLTSLELTTLQVPATMICDTMLGSLMQHHDIDGVIVGADRIVKNGDTANKIGTYQAAVLAQRHGVPFMVVAPVTTVDLSLETGADIHIEHRPAIEATMVRGRNIETGSLDTVRITPEGVGEGQEIWQGVYNPSFDVTPAELISCVVTEKGVAERKEGEKAIDVSSVC